VDDDGAQALDRTGVVQRAAGGGDEVVLVVPGRTQQPRDLPVDGDDIGAAGAGRRHRVQGGVGHAPQLGVGGGERQLGRGMIGDRTEQPGPVAQHAPHDLEDDRRGLGPTAGGGQRGAAEALGQARHGQEGHRHDTVGRQPAAGGDAGVGRRHDDRHRCERVPGLAPAHLGRQQLDSRAPVGGGGDREGHTPERRRAR